MGGFIYSNIENISKIIRINTACKHMHIKVRINGVALLTGISYCRAELNLSTTNDE